MSADNWTETFTLSSGDGKVVVTYLSLLNTLMAERYHGDELIEITTDPDRVKQWAANPAG